MTDRALARSGADGGMMRRVALVLIIAAVGSAILFGAVQASPTRAITDNIAAHWTLDEAASGRADTCGSSNLSDNGGVGQAAGKIGNAASVSGAAYLSVPDNTALSMGNGVSFSVGGWIKLNSTGQYSILASKDNEYALAYASDLGRFAFWIWDSAGRRTFVYSNASVTAGVWYWVLGRYDAGTRTMYVTVSNANEGSSGVAGDVVDSTSPLTIGRGFGTFYSNAVIDDVTIWKRALTAQEQADIFNGAVGQGIATCGAATPSVTLNGCPYSITSMSDAWDGNTLTKFYCAQNGYIGFDFGATTQIYTVRVYSLHGFSGGIPPSSLTFETSNDGASWTAAGEVAPHTPMILTTPISARYVRFNKTASGGWGVSEIQVNDLPVSQMVTQTLTPTATGQASNFMDGCGYKDTAYGWTPDVFLASDGSASSLYKCPNNGIVGYDVGGLVSLSSASFANLGGYGGDPAPSSLTLEVSSDNVTWASVGNVTPGQTLTISPARAARYVRFNKGCTPWCNSWWSVGELQINGQTFPNAAAGAAPLPTPTPYAAGNGVFWQAFQSGATPYPHGYVLKSSDGDLQTYYRADGNGAPIYEFRGEITVTSVVASGLVGYGGDASPGSLSVASSINGQSWSVLGSAYDGMPLAVSTPVSARYLRFYKCAPESSFSCGWWGVGEIKVNDQAFANAPVSTPAPPSSLSSGLAAYWKLEESSGVRHDSIGSSSLSDAYGNVAQGAGKVNNAASFGGSGVLYANDGSALIVAGSSFTLAGWVKLNAKTSDGSIAGRWGTSGAEYLIFYRSSADRFECDLNGYYNNGAGSVFADNFGSPQTGMWYFVACWYDTTNGMMGISVNGSANTKAYSGGVPYTGETFRVGCMGAGHCLTGGVDELGLWDRVLSAAELSVLQGGCTYLFNGCGAATATPTATPTATATPTSAPQATFTPTPAPTPYRALAPQTVTFPTTTLNGAAQTLLGASGAWQAENSYPAGTGWHVTIAASDFINGARIIPVSQMGVELPQSAITVVSGSNAPTSLVTSYAALSTAAQTLLTASGSDGIGVYQFTPNFRLILPADTYAGAYTSTLTITIVGGP